MMAAILHTAGITGVLTEEEPALPLARAILQAIGIYINQSAQSAVDYVLGQTASDSDGGDL